GAVRIRLVWPACSAPMVGTRPTLRWRPRACWTAWRTASTVAAVSGVTGGSRSGRRLPLFQQQLQVRAPLRGAQPELARGLQEDGAGLLQLLLGGQDLQLHETPEPLDLI